MFIPGEVRHRSRQTQVPWTTGDMAAGAMALLLLSIALSLAFVGFVKFADEGLTREALLPAAAAAGAIAASTMVTKLAGVPVLRLNRVVLAALVALALAVAFSSGEGESRTLGGVSLQLVLTLGIVAINVAIPVALTIQKYRIPWAALGFESAIGPVRTLGAFGFWIAGLAVIAGLDALARHIGFDLLTPPQNAEEALELFGRQLLPAVIAVAVFVPIGEELFFRGFVLPAFQNRVGAPAAVVLSAILFALFHVDPGLYLPTFILGLSLGAARVWTGSLWPPIMIHVAQNLLALLVAHQQFGQ